VAGRVYCSLPGPLGALRRLDELFGVLGAGVVLGGQRVGFGERVDKEGGGRASDVSKIGALGYSGRGALVGRELLGGGCVRSHRAMPTLPNWIGNARQPRRGLVLLEPITTEQD
jgi:hypothetical protein